MNENKVSHKKLIKETNLVKKSHRNQNKQLIIK